MAVGINAEIASADDGLEADDAAYLISGLGRAVEHGPRRGVWIERLVFDDAEQRKHPEPIGIGEI